MPYLRGMAKKQTRRSISVSKSTYQRLKTYCETNDISMSQFIEQRVGDFLSCSQSLPEAVPTRDEPIRARPAAAEARVDITPDRIFTF